METVKLNRVGSFYDKSCINPVYCYGLNPHSLALKPLPQNSTHSQCLHYSPAQRDNSSQPALASAVRPRSSACGAQRVGSAGGIQMTRIVRAGLQEGKKAMGTSSLTQSDTQHFHVILVGLPWPCWCMSWTITATVVAA